MVAPAAASSSSWPLSTSSTASAFTDGNASFQPGTVTPQNVVTCVCKSSEKRRPLVDLELDEGRPVTSDELVQLAGALDTTEQRVGSERVHVAHGAQPDRTEALKTRLQRRPELEARGLAPQRSFASAFISA